MKAIMKKAALLMAIPLFAGVFAAGLGTFYARADETSVLKQTVTIGDLPKNTIATEYGEVTGEGANYHVLVGRFNVGDNFRGSQFNAHTDDNNAVTATTVNGLEIRNWKWSFIWNSSVILKFTSKVTGSIVFDFNSITGGWMDKNDLVFNVWRDSAGSLEQLTGYDKGIDTVGGGTEYSGTAADLKTILSTTVEVKAGDVVYYEVGAMGGDAKSPRNIQGVTASTVKIYETTSVDPDPQPQGSWKDPDAKGETGKVVEKVQFNDLPTKVSKASYGVVEATNMKYSTMAGYFDANAANYGLKPFDQYEETDSANILRSTQVPGLELQNWEWMFAANTSVVLVVESKIDGTISFDYSAATSMKVTMDWNSRFTLHVKRAGGGMETLVNFYHNAHSGTTLDYPGSSLKTWEKALIECSVEVGVGDTLYYEMGCDIGGGSDWKRNVQDLTDAEIIATPANEAIREKATLLPQLEELYQSLNEEDFAEENWTKIEGAYNGFVDDDTATTKEEVQTKFDQAKTAIMNAVKDEYKAKLDAVIASLDQNDYSTENWQKVQAEKSKFESALETAETPAKIEELYNAAQSAVMAVESANDTTAKKNELTAKLQEVVDGLDQDDYTAENWQKVQAALKAFKDGLTGCKTEEAVQELYDAQYAALMTAVKAEYTAKLEALTEGRNEEYYTPENWAGIEGIAPSFEEGLSSCETPADVAALYAEKAEALAGYKAYKQEFNYLDYPSTMNGNGYAWIEGDVFDTKLFTGTVEGGLLDFDSQGSTEHIMYNASLNPGLAADKVAHFAENWRWFIGDGASVIVAYKAKADCRITIDCKREASGKTDPSRVWGWTEATQYIIWIVRDGVAKKISSVNAPTTDAQISGEWYMKAGDILYFEYAAPLVTSPRNFQSPCDTIGYGDSTAFDQAKYDEQNHDLSEEVLAKIEECTAQLQNYYASLNNDDYSATNWAQFEQYIDAFIEQCETEVDTVADVEALYNSTLENMKKIQTLAQAAEELEGVKEGFVKELEEEYNKLLAANDYTAENKAKLNEALEAGKTAITAATTRSAANTAKINAVRALNAVESTPKDSGGNGGGNGGSEKGCGSVIASGMVTLVIAAGAVLLLRKKERS